MSAAPGGAEDTGVLDIDFLHGPLGWRGAADADAGSHRFSARARSERVVRACAVAASGPGTRVIDATAGLGADAWVLASAGARVQAVERHPVLALLLEDARQRASASLPEVAARLSVHCGRIEALVADLDADVLYLDPMYAPRRSSALGDGRLRRLALLLTADGFLERTASGHGGDDRQALLDAMLASSVPRVVLKRPRRELTPSSTPASHTLSGRSTCFDVWFRARPSSPPA